MLRDIEVFDAILSNLGTWDPAILILLCPAVPEESPKATPRPSGSRRKPALRRLWPPPVAA